MTKNEDDRHTADEKAKTLVLPCKFNVTKKKKDFAHVTTHEPWVGHFNIIVITEIPL